MDVITKFTQEDIETREAIGVLVRDKDGRILILDHVKLDFFTVPIGKVKPGQDPIQTMIQEVREELGIHVTGFKELGGCVVNDNYDGVPVKIRTRIFEVLAYE